MATRKNRPSRLLNLNKSPNEQKAINQCDRSPLLRLPPELNCRIYDHLFASTAIHVRSAEDEDESSGRHYKLSICETLQQHTETPMRYVEHHNPKFNKAFPGCTIHQAHNKPVVPLDIGLGLLGTCRQVYHEAVLKPFTQISFATIARCYHKYSAVQRFADALISTQAKAIARLRFTVSNAKNQLMDPEYPKMLVAKTTIAKLKGLTHLEIVLAPIVYYDGDVITSSISPELEESFVQYSGMQALVHVRLRSLRVTMEALLHDFGVDDGRYALGGGGGRKDVEAWLRRTEMRLHFGAVMCDDEPLPNFGVVQDDEAIGLPPWATPEGLERIRIEEEEKARLKREAALERRRLLYGQAYGR